MLKYDVTLYDIYFINFYKYDIKMLKFVYSQPEINIEIS